MSIYKIINDHRNSKDDMEYIIKYATKKPYTVWDTDVGTVGCRKEAILQDMVAIKKAYNKDCGKYYEHSVLSITPDHASMKDSDFMEIGRRIASHFIGHQCVYALHKDTKNRHLHFITNTISYKDGKRFNQGPPDLNRMKVFINSILEEYDLDPIWSSPAEMIDTGNYSFSDGWSFLELSNIQPDDRNLFLAPPPKTDPNNTDCCTESAYGISSSWYGGRVGGNSMDSRYFYPAVMPGTVPALSQATVMASGAGSTDGLNLVNVNNVALGNMNDLAAAVRDMGNAFQSSACAGAEALSAMRQHGVNEGVTITTVNNFYVDSRSSDEDEYGFYFTPPYFTK